MNNEIVKKVCHAIGMDNKSLFYKFWGETFHFLPKLLCFGQTGR